MIFYTYFHNLKEVLILISMKRTFFTLILVGILIVVGITYYLYTIPAENIASEKPTVTVKAIDLFNNYSDSLYLNKVVQVEGEINEIDVDQKGDKMLILKEDDDMFGVVCTMDEANGDNQKQLESLKIGDHVVVKGLCTGFDMEVKLNKCIMIHVGKVQAGL